MGEDTSTNKLSQTVICVERKKNRLMIIRQRETWRGHYFRQTLRLEGWKWAVMQKLGEEISGNGNIQLRA